MKTFYISLIVVALVAGVIFGRALWQPEENIGSTVVGNDYDYQQLTGSVATTTVIAARQVALGSIIVTEDAGTAVVMYDATSSAAITDGTYSTRVADLESGLTEGTYTFDVQMKRGLTFQAVDGYTFDGDWTITFR